MPLKKMRMKKRWKWWWRQGFRVGCIWVRICSWWTVHAVSLTSDAIDRNDDDDDDDDDDDGGVHPNSHKHFIPYMGFCASIWDSVRHHCHHHHHHHDHLKWTVKQQRRRPKNLWANFKRLGWMDISILRHGPALDGRQTWQTTARKPTMASSTGR